jgi:predicted ATPase
MDLLERQTQLGELARTLHQAGTSAGKIAFVSGEAGVGKSVLVEEFTQQVARAARVLWGHCDALQTSRVLGPVNEVVAGLSLLPGAQRESALSRDQLFSRLLERLSPPNPVSIVVLEDLHWADEATLDFLRFIGRRIQRTRCLLIATYRDDELAPTHLLRGVLGELTGQHTAAHSRGRTCLLGTPRRPYVASVCKGRRTVCAHDCWRLEARRCGMAAARRTL